MVTQLQDIFPRRYHRILDSILPGGEGWHRREPVECLETCPFFDTCEDWGPSKKLCSTEWKITPTKPIVWMVLKHIFDNFESYDYGDLKEDNLEAKLGEIAEILDFPFDQSLSPAEARVIVKVRLKQAEFKAKLFLLWKGCSLKEVDIGDRYLIASHIVPWSEANDEDKVNQYNGFLLPPNYDYLFDRHLISFANDGTLLRHAGDKMNGLYKELGVNSETKLKNIYKKNLPFLSNHRKVFNGIYNKVSNENS